MCSPSNVSYVDVMCLSPPEPQSQHSHLQRHQDPHFAAALLIMNWRETEDLWAGFGFDTQMSFILSYSEQFETRAAIHIQLKNTLAAFRAS